MRYTVVHGNTGWKCESYTNGRENGDESNQSSVTLSGGRRRKTRRTFGDFDPLDRFIVDGTGALFDELVAFDTKIEDIGALHGQVDEPFHRDIDDVSRCLPSRRYQDQKKKRL